MIGTFAAPRWRIDLARTAATGIGGLGALTLAGWPHNAAVTTLLLAVGATAGLLVAVGLETHLRMRSQFARLEDVERQAEADRGQADAIKRHLEWQVQVAKQEAALNALHMKVYADAFHEVGGTKRIPFGALLARIEVSTKAANLHIPLEPPKFGT
jgi:hypothetical protein